MEDIISQLPDDILISILARLPSPEALRTSILSKRWRNLFKSMTNISFARCCTIKIKSYYSMKYRWLSIACMSPSRKLKPSIDYCDSKAIIDGVHGVLQRRSAYIHSFKLSACLSKLNTDTFEQCIYSLGELGIEKLSLRASCRVLKTLTTSSLPFSCHLLSHMLSLKYLKLKFCYLQPNLKTSCNSLQTLKLYYVRAPPGSIECILSNCLSLCVLTFKECQFHSKLCFRGPNLQLKYLAILECKGFEEIDFFASNLMTFDFYGVKKVNFIFDYVPQLQNIYLSVYQEDIPYFCGMLEKKLLHLKTLVLDDIGNLHRDGSISLGINMFRSLTRLELTVFHEMVFDLFSLTLVLHCCPLLHEFHLAARPSRFWWPKEEKHVVIHSHLKKVEISGFGGSESEVNFASFILRSAVQLEQMFISWHSLIYYGFGEWVEEKSPPLNSKEWNEIYEKIQELIKLEAVSKTVQVIIQKSPHVKSKQF